MLRTTATFGVALALFLAWTGPAAADTSWLPSWLGGKSDEVTSSKSKPSKSTKAKKADSKPSSNLFTSTKDLFAPKKKNKRIVSQYPSDRVKVSRHQHDERSWLSRMFLEEEKGPPRSVNEWMDLEQIKP